MSSRTRLIVMSISAPVIAFAIVGGFLGKVMAREETYQHLAVFDDVVHFIMNNYVEEVNADTVMHGAMHGLADQLDPDSAYLSADEVKQVESGVAAIGPHTSAQIKTVVADLARAGATKLIVDVRRTSSGTPDQGLAVARMFVAKGTLAVRETKGAPQETIAAVTGDGAVTLPA